MDRSRQMLMTKICFEFIHFKEKMLQCAPQEIFRNCHQIEVMCNLYKILMEITGLLSEVAVDVLYQEENILEELYQHWTKQKDCQYLELKEHVERELHRLVWQEMV